VITGSPARAGADRLRCRLPRVSFLDVDEAGRSYLTEPERYVYRQLADNVAHVVVEGDDLWSIAGKYYAGSIVGGETLYWVIGDFQPEPVIDPTVAFEVGSAVIVPSVRTVLEEILSEKRRSAGVRY
jgi:hypothetical protein